MRLATLVLLLLTSVAWADDTRARRVRVALALAAAQQCGECRFDEAGCRAEALRDNKPLVLFVGAGCSQCGKVAQSAGAVACVTDKYEHDEFPVNSPRAVILEPKPGGGFWRIDTLLNPTEATLKAALDKLKAPHSPAPTITNQVINWSF